MATSRENIPEPFRSQIEQATLEFATAIARAFEQSVVAVSHDLVDPHTPRNAAIEKRIESVLQQKRGGWDIEQLHQAVDIPRTTLLSTLQQMVVQGRIVRRYTEDGNRFFPR
ncbi:MAG TPA: hypothetical protein PLJ27_22090 [Polyangiaceae bacterium]|jgi:hypothetical protein|nr:MAG: hypothetical protein BWY17_00457 [Deltaproteobacteria bacterium ADurb.Bin207]HNS96082.1 hypothetical protein [Polyangiaceae bacterium]HNZ20914.1 hypothetical protein [Polyangiaceae bacterium]HOD21487.1 hypothetical protein [Polyangiaceae bacterium]HOE47595.1 hypothetical protein [Polyangiaceae bacterium]